MDMNRILKGQVLCGSGIGSSGQGHHRSSLSKLSKRRCVLTEVTNRVTLA